MARNRDLVRSYGEDLRLLKSPHARVATGAFLLLMLLLPILVENDWLVGFLNDDGFMVPILVYSGIFATGAIGLNLLTGFTGQVSLGHAFFLGAGAYTAAYVGDQHGLPLWLWLPAAGVVGGLIGAVVGPFALRLRGNYLVIVTLGLVFIGQHLWFNWESVTGGTRGATATTDLALGPLDFAQLEVFGREFTFNQSFYYLSWLVVLAAVIVAKNIVRSRPGRAMQAVRDRDLAAEVIGVSLFRYKVGAFAVSSAFAAVTGALLGSYIGHVSPESWNLILSIEFVAMIIIGGIGTIFGSILGAVALAAMPRVIEHFSGDLPGVADSFGRGGVITADALSLLLYGVLIIVFLVVEPHGLAAVWFRLKTYFRTWPFSY